MSCQHCSGCLACLRKHLPDIISIISINHNWYMMINVNHGTTEQNCWFWILQLFNTYIYISIYIYIYMYSTSSNLDIARNRLKPFPAIYNLKTQIAPNSLKQFQTAQARGWLYIVGNRSEPFPAIYNLPPYSVQLQYSMSLYKPSHDIWLWGYVHIP